MTAFARWILACFVCFGALRPNDTQAQAATLSELLDPQRLSRLSASQFERNVYQILWILHEGRRRLPPETALRGAYEELGERQDLTEERQTRWLRMLRVLNDTGVMDHPGEVEKLRRGSAPTAMRGTYSGDPLQLTRIVPQARAPDFANEIANVQLLATSAAKRQRRYDSQAEARLRKLFPNGQAPAPQPEPAATPEPVAPPVGPAPLNDMSFEVEVEFGAPYSMADWGGPERDFILISEEANSIRFAVLDYTITRTLWRYDQFGYSYPIEIPTEYRRQAPKANAIPVQGTLSKIYPLYRIGSFQIYFNDTLSTLQNHRRLVIVPPE